MCVFLRFQKKGGIARVKFQLELDTTFTDGTMVGTYQFSEHGMTTKIGSFHLQKFDFGFSFSSGVGVHHFRFDQILWRRPRRQTQGFDQ
jgi:hypothetical protein